MASHSCVPEQDVGHALDYAEACQHFCFDRSPETDVGHMDRDQASSVARLDVREQGVLYLCEHGAWFHVAFMLRVAAANVCEPLKTNENI
jgi:hypothetical protein